MVGQWRSLEEFDKWVERNRGMRSFARRMGLDPERARAMVEDARKAHADIDSGKATALEPITDPYKRLYNYKHTLHYEQGGKCKGCNEVFKLGNMTIDHILPRSRGGTDDPSNLQLLCARCNSSKGDRTQEEWIEWLKEKGRR